MSRFLRRAAPSLLQLRSRNLSASAPPAPPLFNAPLSSSSSSSWGGQGGERRRLSSLAASDASLLRVVEAEIKCAENCDGHDPLKAAPEGFPFQIEDEQGTKIIRLSRTYQGKERIEVAVSLPIIHTKEIEEGQKLCPFYIHLSVRVSRENGATTLDFEGRAYSDMLSIDSISVRKGEQEGEGDGYEGSDFDVMDKNLKKELHNYLEVRGVTLLNTNFLLKFMICKYIREYLLFLCKLKAFLAD